MQKTIWEEDRSKSKEKTVDILIIGGGMTGWTTAYFLKDSNKKVMLIDKGKFLEGVTARTTAKISYLQKIIYQTLEKKHGFSVAKQYLDSQLDAIQLIKNIIEKNHISCDWEASDSIIFTCEENGIPKIKKEASFLKRCGISTKEVKHPEIKVGISVSGTYVFQPLKYLEQLKEIVEDSMILQENTTATNVKKEKDTYYVTTTSGIIKANKVVLACHYPFYIFPTLIPIKTYVKKEYVNVAPWNNPHFWNAISIDKTLHSIRFYKNNILYGSHEQKTTEKLNYGKSMIQSQIDFETYFGVKPTYTWSNQDVMSHDHLPMIGQVENNLYIATAYQAWGMTNATIAGKLIADNILGKENKYQKLFDPKRWNVALCVNGLCGSFLYAKSYAVSFFQKNVPSYIKIKGFVYGIYKDENDKLHQIKLICPHMKCNLVFNQTEKTWDCPCHGSRFDLDGHLIEGPAVKNLKNTILQNENKKF